MPDVPVTAIVIFRNEAHLLERCLSALRWCDELIAVDMQSTDNSAAIAATFADRLYTVPPAPIAEPTRVAAARLAGHDWVLLVDPDEVIPGDLANDIGDHLVKHPHAGAFELPMWFYFKNAQLHGTVWGTLTNKLRLIHRQRCDLLPWCNRISRLKPGQACVRIPHTGRNHIRHYWSNSYRDLLHKHFCRYAHTEAKAMVAEGKRFTFKRAFIHPLTELYRCLRHFDGLRLGPRGWALSAIYFAYTLASDWLMLYYQHAGGNAANDSQDDEQPLPTLHETPLAHARARNAA